MPSFPKLDIKKMRSAVHTALRNWYKVGGKGDDLLNFLLLVQEEQDKQADMGPSTFRFITNTLIESAMAELESENAEEMQVLRLRFLDEEQIDKTAVAMNMSEHTVSHKQSDAIGKVARLLLAWEEIALAEKAAKILAHLPPPSSPELFGIESPLAALLEEVLKPEEPWITAVTGIGGLGKTSLALAATREIAQFFHFENIIWVTLDPGTMVSHFVSAEALRDYLTAAISDKLWPETKWANTPQQRLSRVRHTLKHKHILVIVDNVESDEDSEWLMQCLNDWSDPTKFLLTSRVRPQGAYNISLDELSLAAAAEVVHYHLRLQNRGSAAALTGPDMEAIYEHTGGNPMALKLVANLMDALPLATVLAGLLTVNTKRVENLYRHIYWQNWETISEAARILLQMMVVASKDGVRLDYLQGIWEKEPRDLEAAVTELRYRSLLEVSSDLHDRRYSIHSLTRSFLQTEIIHWPPTNDAPQEK